jgi:plastocyanin
MNNRGAVSLAFLALFGSACSEHTTQPTEPNDNGATVVVISDFAFTAQTITIDRGTSVRWRSSTPTFHTVTPDGHQAFAGHQLSGQGQSYEVRFDTPGRYRYYCEPHRAFGMTGEVVVQ